MASNPLSPTALLGLAEASIIPKPSQTSSAQVPQTLRNPYDAIALIVHACMLSIGFRLIGFTEDDKLGSYCAVYPLLVHLVFVQAQEIIMIPISAISVPQWEGRCLLENV